MAIKIVPEDDIHLTESEYSRLRNEWLSFCSYHANPPSFEDYVRTKKMNESRELLQG